MLTTFIFHKLVSVICKKCRICKMHVEKFGKFCFCLRALVEIMIPFEDNRSIPAIFRTTVSHCTERCCTPRSGASY